MADKLYLVTRSDLPAGQQAVQAAHALQAFNVEHPAEARQWHDQSNTLALLAVPNEQSLAQLLRKARWRGPVSEFREPDRGGELTAIAIGPWGKGITARLPLALAV